MQSQKGNYWDSFVSVTLDYDKRNQRYRTSEGFRSTYNIDMPILVTIILWQIHMILKNIHLSMTTTLQVLLFF